MATAQVGFQPLSGPVQPCAAVLESIFPGDEGQKGLGEVGAIGASLPLAGVATNAASLIELPWDCLLNGHTLSPGALSSSNAFAPAPRAGVVRSAEMGRV